MLVLFLQGLAALHFVGLVAIIAMMQMDRFDAIRRNLAIALLVTFGSGTGLVILLEQIQPFIWEDSGNFKLKRGKGGQQGGAEEEDGEGGGGGGGGGNDGGSRGQGGPGDGVPSHKPKGILQDCEKCPDMVAVRGGSYAMGARPGEDGAQPAELPQIAEVKIASFAIGRFEVTRDQYMDFVKATKHALHSSCEQAAGAGRAISAAKPGFPVDGWHPMVCVSWTDALKYAGWLSNVTGKSYRLPTAAEWEYAARAGNPYPFQNGTPRISADEARFALAKATAETGTGTTAVGSFSSNSLGLFDLHGNAAEWVEDCHASSLTESPTNGKPLVTGAQTGCARVAKGGGWHSTQAEVRWAARAAVSASTASNGIGFRVARNIE